MTAVMAPAPVVFCGCGCGEATNLTTLRALEMRASGMTVQDIADELGSSQGSMSTMLKRGAVGDFPRFLRGHASRVGRTHRPLSASAAPESVHEHEWEVAGSETIGGVVFRIDACSACRTRRACRLAGPQSIPAPATRRKSAAEGLPRRSR